MHDTAIVVDDGTTELARIPIPTTSYDDARAAGIAAAEDAATRERPVRVALHWRLHGELTQQVLHVALG